MPTRRKATVKPEGITESSGNVFLDIGFPPHEAGNLLMRAELMSHIRELIRLRKMTQSQAAKLFHVTQPRISDLSQGKIQLFSIDFLVAMLSHAGVKVQLQINPKAA